MELEFVDLMAMETSMPPAYNRAILLDRDGIINHDPGDYTTCVAEFHILPTVLETLRKWKAEGFKLILITNQGGIAKGRYGHSEVEAIHTVLRDACDAVGAPLDDIFYSPHHPDCGASLSRKPGSLMVEKALAKHRLDPGRCWMFGDKKRDIECALGAGVRHGVLLAPNAPLAKWVSLPLGGRP